MVSAKKKKKKFLVQYKCVSDVGDASGTHRKSKDSRKELFNATNVVATNDRATEVWWPVHCKVPKRLFNQFLCVIDARILILRPNI